MVRWLFLCLLIVTLPAYAAVELDLDNNQAIDVSRGGTNSTTAAGAKANLGLGNVDNTSDLNKPISTLTQAALDGKQDIGFSQADSGSYDSLNEAIAEFGSNPTTLRISTPNFPLNANAVVPSTLILDPVFPGSIDQGAHTLTINSPFTAGNYQVFTGSGSVVINSTLTAGPSYIFPNLTFGTNAKFQKAYPEWWGAVGDGLTDDTSAIQSALTYASNAADYEQSSVVSFSPRKTYITSRPLEFYGDSITLEGNNCTIRKTTDLTPAVTIPNRTITGGDIDPNVNAVFLSSDRVRWLRMRDFNIEGLSGTSTPKGIYFFGYENTFSNINIRDVSVGVEAASSWLTRFEQVVVRDSSSHGFWYNRARLSGTGQTGTSVTFANCASFAAGGKGFYLQDVDYTTLQSCAVDHAVEEAYFFQGCSGVNGHFAWESKDASSTTPAVRFASVSSGSVIIDSFDDTALAVAAIMATESKIVISGRLRTDYDYYFDASLNSVIDARNLDIDPISGTELDWTKFVVATNAQVLYSPAASPGNNYPLYQVNDVGVRIANQPHGTTTAGDQDVTISFANGTDTYIFTAPITTNRAVAFPSDNVANGIRYRIVRSSAATGAFNVNVGTGPLKALGIGQWCDVEYNGSAWVLIGFGSL